MAPACGSIAVQAGQATAPTRAHDPTTRTRAAVPDPRKQPAGGVAAHHRQTTFIGNHAAATTVCGDCGRARDQARPPCLTTRKVAWLSRAMLQRHTTANPTRTLATAAASLLVLVLITEPTGAGRAGA